MPYILFFLKEIEAANGRSLWCKITQACHGRDQYSLIKSTRFFARQGHQHQMTLIPLLEKGGNHIPNSQSRYCKEFMDSKFKEVIFGC